MFDHVFSLGLNCSPVLAQVNVGWDAPQVLGVLLLIAGAGLYFLRSKRPELSRDYDIFFAAVGLLCGGILVAQGWRLDPILAFGQFLLSGSAIFFAVEAIRLRGAATAQARRNTPTVDDERSVSRVYRAELDQLDPYEEDEDPSYSKRRLSGYQDPRSPRRTSGYEEPTSRSPRRRSSGDRYSSPPSRRRPARPSNPPQDPYQDWSSETDEWNSRPPTERSRTRRRPKPSNNRSRSPRPSNPLTNPPIDERDQRPRRSASRSSDFRVAPSRDLDDLGSDYVDYQPIDEADSTQSSNDWRSGQETETSRDRPPKSGPNGDNPVNFDY